MPEVTTTQEAGTEIEVELTVNGTERRMRVEARKTLCDALRDDLRLTGTHVGCEHGFIMSMTAYLRDNPDPTEEDLRDGLSGNLCRCTGYQGIIKAAHSAITEGRQTAAEGPWDMEGPWDEH
jgi:aerobic-type carbon monoxide dehydrogenase small subunit (CoxS/CutS family)